MVSFVTQTRIALSSPRRIMAPLCEHLAEHGAEITRGERQTIVRMGGQHASISLGEDYVLAEVHAPDMEGLRELKQVLASHVLEFSAPDTPHIVWEGDGSGLASPPDFRVMTVVGTTQLTPHMKRIRLTGQDLARFDNPEALHVRLFLPAPGEEPAWPMLGENGLIQTSAAPLPVRKYTIRSIDVAKGEVEIDFVLHDTDGPGSSFAKNAAAGDRIGMAGPGGRGLRPADRYVFLGDETALPAIARMLELLPRNAEGHAFIEVADQQERQAIHAPPGIDVRWLYRNDVRAAEGQLLLEALETLELGRDDGKVYVWAGLENAAFREVRALARRKLRAGHDEHLIVGYWQRNDTPDADA